MSRRLVAFGKTSPTVFTWIVTNAQANRVAETGESLNGELSADGFDGNDIVAIYGLDGRARAELQSGVNVVLFKNGEARSVAVK